MKIGELAKTAKVSARMLRYYEEQGLITPDRAANGYRDAAQCSGLQAGGEGPRGRGRQTASVP